MSEQLTPSQSAYQMAREQIQAILAGTVENAYPKPVYGNVPVERSTAWMQIHRLLEYRDDLLRTIESAKREMDLAVPYLNGQAGALDGNGILRSRGGDIDRLTIQFRMQLDIAVEALSRVLQGSLQDQVDDAVARLAVAAADEKISVVLSAIAVRGSVDVAEDAVYEANSGRFDHGDAGAATGCEIIQVNTL